MPVNPQGTVRYGTLMAKSNIPLYDQVCKDFNVPKTTLLEVLLLGIDSSDLSKVIARGKEMRKKVAGISRTERKAMRDRIKNLSPEQLSAFLALIDKEQAATPVAP
jgi:butyrate kinase